MLVRDVLVHLKSHEDWSPHVDYAISTAKAFGARLNGLVTFADAVVLRSLLRFGDDAVADQIRKDAAIASRLEEKFLKACTAAGVSGRFSTAEGPASEIMPWAARYHDMTIVEQRQPEQDELGFDAAEETALSAGRPVLLVPRLGHAVACPDHILLAWNGSHQAASALHGALPFLARAKRVTVCTGEQRVPLRTSIRVPHISLSEYLKSYVGEVVEEKVDVPASAVGEHITGRANDLGCGMIVMGFYGRSWFSEYALGGATRYILSNMSVPILTGR